MSIISSARIQGWQALVHQRNWISLSVLTTRNSSRSLPKIAFSRNHSSSATNSGWAQWKGIATKFLPIGICLVAVMQWRAYRRSKSGGVAQDWEVKCYCMLPLRSLSRCWGWLADKKLPEFVRPYVYQAYSKTFGVKLDEALDQNLKSYPSLADFFARPLKEGIRPVSMSSDLVSPCDGTVLHLGSVQTGQVEQVKGVTYSLENFLGGQSVRKAENLNCDYRKRLLHNSDKKTSLFQCVIYLAPGDYHRFHSPAEWKPTHRKHFSGELLSVNPAIAKWVPGLFCLNERVVYLGSWSQGFFSFTAVGATNVGTVKVYFDRSLQTNVSKKTYRFKDMCLGNSINLRKGELFGEFRMGSTIVLIFEAPENFKFNIKAGQRVQMGQSIGEIEKQKFVDRIHDIGSSVVNVKNRS